MVPTQPPLTPMERVPHYCQVGAGIPLPTRPLLIPPWLRSTGASQVASAITADRL